MVKRVYTIYSYRNPKGGYVQKNMDTKKITIKDRNGKVISASEFFKKYGKDPVSEIDSIILDLEKAGKEVSAKRLEVETTRKIKMASSTSDFDKSMIDLDASIGKLDADCSMLSSLSKKYRGYEICVKTMTPRLIGGYRVSKSSTYTF